MFIIELIIMLHLHELSLQQVIIPQIQIEDQILIFVNAFYIPFYVFLADLSFGFIFAFAEIIAIIKF